MLLKKEEVNEQKDKPIIAGSLSAMLVGRALIFGDGSSYGILYAETIALAVEVARNNELSFESKLTVSGRVEKGVVSGDAASDSTPIYVVFSMETGKKSPLRRLRMVEVILL